MSEQPVSEQPVSDLIVCPSCHRDEHLAGEPLGALIRLTCSRCDLVWDRDPAPRCATCGEDDMQPVPQAVWEKTRGNQLTTVALRTLYLCRRCDAERIRRHVDSGSPLPPDENPAAGNR